MNALFQIRNTVSKNLLGSVKNIPKIKIIKSTNNDFHKRFYFIL